MKNLEIAGLEMCETLTNDEAGRVIGGCDPASAIIIGLGIGVLYGIWYFTKGPGSNVQPAPEPQPSETSFELQPLR